MDIQAFRFKRTDGSRNYFDCLITACKGTLYLDEMKHSTMSALDIGLSVLKLDEKGTGSLNIAIERKNYS